MLCDVTDSNPAIIRVFMLSYIMDQALYLMKAVVVQTI